MNPQITLLIWFLFNLILICQSDPGPNCPKSNLTLTNFVSQFTMSQHQLRGVIKIINDCSFRVSEFDMLKGSDVHWWGALGPTFDNLTSGFVISDHKLNGTYMNDSLVVRLKSNLTWDSIRVISVWDIPTASDFGHVVLPESENGSYTFSNESGINGKLMMLDNCKTLAKNFRLRWSLNEHDNLIDIGLEAATGLMNYMSFGWAKPDFSSDLMIHSDVAITGFIENGSPFVDDYFVTKYSECMINKDGSAQGVCPDSIYEASDPVGLVNNTKLVYGQRRDGVSFIRYQRPLKSVDVKYDWPVNVMANMTVIWALGLIRPPDTLRPYYLPQNHGGPRFEAYGDFILNVSHHINDCFGPLDSNDKEDQDIITTDGKNSLVVTTGVAKHYPNPPNPSKVLFINKKEAPVLRVERGVPVKFSIQAGHDLALYITSDPLGGNATVRSLNETIYAGGPEAEGVQSTPTDLIWIPDRNTPDQVYYHSVYEQKMGWKVQVVDGGLPDMYNNSVILDDQQVTLFWTLLKDSISIAARGEKKSGYLAIGFGSGMANSFSYVGWIDDLGKGHVDTYWIDGKDASNVHPTNENLTYVRCRSENGLMTFEFTRPLKPLCKRRERPECSNIVDPTTPLKVIWAMGAKWSDENLSERNMHSITSTRPVLVLLMRGSAEALQDLRPVLAVHGFMMFLAFGILLPGGVLAARYLKHVKGDGWFQIHVYLQYSGLSIILLGFLFAVAELRGFYVTSLHVKFGIAAILLACVQPLNAYFRPNKPLNGEVSSSKRVTWEYLHVICGRSAMIVGIAALFSGMKHLGERYGGENVDGLNWALIMWFFTVALIIFYLEYRQTMRRKGEISLERNRWVLGNAEDDSAELLSPARVTSKESHSFERMEIQLEPLDR